jgi:hypothetical protein
MAEGVATFLQRRLTRWHNRLNCDYKADGFGVRNKNISFLDEPRFAEAWKRMLAGDHGPVRKAKWFNGRVPDIRWRAHVNCWAANSVLNLPGDFVECGTATGIQAGTICAYLEFETIAKKFYLFDTFAGIPITPGMSDGEKAYAAEMNSSTYFDCYQATSANFAGYPNVKLVRGMLPGSLAEVTIEQISYLHVDLNNAAAEIGVARQLFPRVTPGGFIVLDDYAFSGHEQQHNEWNRFAASVGHPILTLPTGQGLLVKR